MTPFSVAISDRGDLTIEYTGLLKLLGPELTEAQVRRTLGLVGLTAGRIDVEPSMVEWDESGLPDIDGPHLLDLSEYEGLVDDVRRELRTDEDPLA